MSISPTPSPSWQYLSRVSKRRGPRASVARRAARDPDTFNRRLLNLQEVRGQAKPYQIRQFLRLVERYALSLEEEQ
jgi:hypothetical protein